VICFSAAAPSTQAEQRLQRMALALRLPGCDAAGLLLAALNARPSLPSGLRAMGVSEAQFASVINGAMADHCHKNNPRLASRGECHTMLVRSM